jgi:hypothetical protein
MTLTARQPLRYLRLALAAAIVIGPAIANAPVVLALPTGSVNVAYVYDFGFGSPGSSNCPAIDAGGTGINDKNPPGCGASIFRTAVTGGVIGTGNTGTYGGVNFTNVTVATVDANPTTAFNGFDSVMLNQVCDIHSHPNLITALNNFLNSGGKVMIFDGDRCAPPRPPFTFGGQADYTGFLFPFSTNSPGPTGSPAGKYTSIDSSSLTTGLPLYMDSSSPLQDAMADANIFTTSSGAWCKSITGTNLKGVTGFVEAYATTVAGGLVVYEGEDYWFTFNDSSGVNPHYKQVFDLVLHQRWNPDGLPCTHPASGIKLTPLTSTHLVGESQMLTANVFDVNNNNKPGITVNLKITSGPDMGQVFASQVTDPSGNATFTLTNTGGAGTDVAVASFVDINGTTQTSNNASVIFNPRSTALTVNPATSDYHDPGTVSAVLTDTTTSMPVANATVVFTMGAESCSGTTNLSGLASCSITPSEAAGTYLLKASFAGDANHVASTGSNNFVVTREETTLTYTGPINFPNGSSATLSAVLKEDGVTPIGGSRLVTFTLGIGATAQTCQGHTASSGIASCVIPVVNQPLGPGTVSATFAGDPFYLPSSDSRTTLEFGFLASGSFVIGNGQVATGSTVTYWSDQWAKQNQLSGGPAPRSFKGFADHTSKPPACLAGWSSDPGNSSKPPATVPTYMAVIVSSSIDQTGSTISGDTVKIVVVKTNAGYAANPGHPGTGTVVAVIC